MTPCNLDVAPDKSNGENSDTRPRLKQVVDCIERLHLNDREHDYAHLIAGGDFAHSLPLTSRSWLRNPAQLVIPAIRQYQYQDSYLSQNAFKGKRRLGAEVSRLNCLFVDVDAYGHSPTATVAAAREILLDSGIIPATDWTFSGRGIYLRWLLKATPATPENKAKWESIESYLVNLLKPIGADQRVQDLARVLRLDGTINSKSGLMVRTTTESGKRYSLAELYQAIEPNLVPEATFQGEAVLQENRFLSPATALSFRIQGHRRLSDLSILETIRGGVLEGSRRYCAIVAAMTQRGLGYDEPAIANAVHGLKFLTTTEPFTFEDRQEAIRASVDFPRLKTDTIVDWLGITPREERRLGVLVSGAERKRRHVACQVGWNRQQRSTAVTERRKRFIVRTAQVFGDCPGHSLREYGEMLAVSYKTVSNALAVLGLRTSGKPGRPRKLPGI